MFKVRLAPSEYRIARSNVRLGTGAARGRLDEELEDGMTAIITIPFEDIEIGRRLRQLRESTVTELMGSIRAVGLLNPVSVTRDGRKFRLLAGAHRLEAVKRLNYARVQAIVIDTIKNAGHAAELAEIDENLIRADLSPAEIAMHVTARKLLYEKLHPETKAGGVRRGSKAQIGPLKNDSFTKDTAKKTGKSATAIKRDATRGKNVKVLADIAGTCLDKGDEIDALGKLNEDQQRNLAAKAKAGEKVSAKTTARQVQRAEREQELGQKQTALPDQKFGVIVADPEWDDETWSEAGKNLRHPSNHYPTSAAKVIESRAVRDIAAADCVLFLWSTSQHLDIAITVLKAWGFEYKSNYVWDKIIAGTGRWNRSVHEVLLIGTIGNPPCPAPGLQWESIIREKRQGEHSTKPEQALQMIEEYFPNLPKIELNLRGNPRPGWSGWGLEAGAAAE